MAFGNISVDVDLSDVFSEIGDIELIEEVKDRGLESEFNGSKEQPLVKETPLNDIKIMLCDNFALSHVTEWDVIIERLKTEV